MGIDLTEKPFYLKDDDVKWVKETIAVMTIEEKIGQLFINLGKSTEENYIRDLAERYHIGGVRYTETAAEKIYEQNKLYQAYSKIPVLIAANCETGGNGACKEGTLVATEAQCGATHSDRAAYEMGRISGIEADAIGCNWTFGPIVDILFNWRNTIVNTRAFGKDPKEICDMAKAYVKGVQESNILACAKHFPGDGVEERDQHLLMGVNDLSCEEWDNSFGKVYKELIDDGLESIMVGHIALPSYSKKLKPDIKMDEIMPATLAPELITDLLRNQLGFHGLVLTDASHMGGLLGAKPRSEQVPGAIAAGCDMFLFLHDIEEDIQYMMDGYKQGIITEERLQDALERILGMKARLKLHRKHAQKVYAGNKDNLKKIGCLEHRSIAKSIADQSITLVKDTQQILPIDIRLKKRARLYYLESEPTSYQLGTDPAKQIVIEELRNAGFDLDVNESYYEMEAKKSSPFNRYKAMEMPTVEEFKNNYDVVFVFVHMKGYAQENNVRVKYSAAHSNELPWWVREVPTVCVSLSYTNHLYDLPMMKTYINAYAPTRECIQATIDKIVGKSEFMGKYNDNVWCERWDTQL
jgi:beta-N-acetylhexosaminidase